MSKEQMADIAARASGGAAFTALLYVLLAMAVTFYLDVQQRKQIEDLQHRVKMLELRQQESTVGGPHE